MQCTSVPAMARVFCLYNKSLNNPACVRQALPSFQVRLEKPREVKALTLRHSHGQEITELKFNHQFS